jgi:hypothetical protein
MPKLAKCRREGENFQKKKIKKINDYENLNKEFMSVGLFTVK